MSLSCLFRCFVICVIILFIPVLFGVPSLSSMWYLFANCERLGLGTVLM